MEDIMFNFRIIETPEGDQIIDRTLKTPFNALTPLQMLEYAEMDEQISYMDMLERKDRAEVERKKKMARNPIYRMACLCGLVWL